MEMPAVNYEQLAEDYRRVERAIRFLEEHVEEQPDLKELAGSVGLSEYHFQRLFSRWVGISPKRFMQYLTKERARALLGESRDLLGVAFESGLSGPSRLHDLFIAWEAATPGEIKRLGAGLEILYGFHPTPFGECLLALTERGVCHLAFVAEGERQAALQSLAARWASAALREDAEATRPLANRIFELFRVEETGPIRLHLKGTNFQLKVWEALLRIPPGRVVSYEDLALQVGMPGAARAVARAVASNPVPVLIPCHRVIRKAGDFGGYRWGPVRKKALLGWEAACLERGRPRYDAPPPGQAEPAGAGAIEER